MAEEREQAPGRTRKLVLLACGMCVVAAAAALAGVYGSRKVAENKRARSESVESKNYDDPYLGLVKANQPVASPTSSGLGSLGKSPQPAPIPVQTNPGNGATSGAAWEDDDQTDRDYDQPGRWANVSARRDRLIGDSCHRT
jgi:hypothetical protein